MIKVIYSAIVGGLSKYMVAILVGLLLAAGIATIVIYKELGSARQEATSALKSAKQYQSLADASKSELEASDALYKATIKSLTNRASVAESQAKKFKEQNRDLQDALDHNRDWADSPIPVGVLNALKRP